MRVIGLTGGIGSGKTTISHYLGELGAVVIDADKVGHEAFKPGTEAWNDVVKTFGKDVIAENGEVDRKKLGAIVFGDPVALKTLNSIMHPRMKEMMRRRLEELRAEGVSGVVIEAAILIEAGWTDLVDEVWVATAPEAAVLARVKAQRGVAEEQTKARISAQLSTEERVKHADAVINNSGDLAAMREQVRGFWERLNNA